MPIDTQNTTWTTEDLREFETDIAAAFREGKIHAPVHFSSGNEEQLINIFRGLRDDDYVRSGPAYRAYSRTELIENKYVEVPAAMHQPHPVFNGVKKEDWLFVSYRSHYHALLKGVPREWVKNEILEGRSMYPMSAEYKIYSSAIVPGHLPIAVGMALALKIKNEQGHVWAFCGDMASETGIFEECAKYSEGHNLPITFVIEDNGLSVDTPTYAVWNTEPHPLRFNTIRYAYTSGVPHQGMGKEVGF